MSANAFKPKGLTARLDVTGTSTATPVQVDGNINDATERLIYNQGPNDAFLAHASTQAGAVAVKPVVGTPSFGMAIPAGAVLVLGFPPKTWFAAICAAGETAAVFISGGEGN